MTTVGRGLRACAILVGLAGPAFTTPALAVSAGRALDVTGVLVGPIGSEQVGLTLVLSPKAAGRCTGTARGTLALFGAPGKSPVAGALGRGRYGCELPLSVPYAAIPATALGRARLDAVELGFQGEVQDGASRRPVDWNGFVPRGAVGLTESMRVTLRRFVEVPDLHLGGVGFARTTVTADVVVKMPLHFGLRIVEARCDVEVNGRKVASGGREKFILHPRTENRLAIPITVENGALIAAAGQTSVTGGKVEGRLTGHARVRLPGGDVDFPVDFPVRMSLR